jgi:hypothetical protein
MGRAAAVGFLPTRAEPMTFWVSELWLYVEDTHSHIHSYSVAVRRLLLTYIEILSVLKTWVVCLLVTVADVRGKWLHRCAQCRAYSEHKVTWLGRLPSTFVSFFLLWLIYDPVSSKALAFKNRISECAKLDALFRHCEKLTDGYYMVVASYKPRAWFPRDNAWVFTDPCHADLLV